MTTITKCLGTDHPLCSRCLRRTTTETDGCGWITAPRISRQGRGGCRDYVEDKGHEDDNR